MTRKISPNSTHVTDVLTPWNQSSSPLDETTYCCMHPPVSKLDCTKKSVSTDKDGVGRIRISSTAAQNGGASFRD